MKLNPDCTRDILKYSEEFADGCQSWLVSSDLPAELMVYTESEVSYHVGQCANAGYLEIGNQYIDGSFEVVDLLPAGHRVLASIRNPAVFRKAKSEWPSEVLSGAVSASISGFFSLASEIARNALLS